MKYAILSLFLALPAHAHSVVCVGPNLSYSIFRPDGGPSIAPSEQLFAMGRLQISVIPWQNEGVRNATFELPGKPTPLGKAERHDKYYVTTRYSQRAKVADSAGQSLFDGEVICHEENYDGPPIP